MRAARRFAVELENDGLQNNERVARVCAELFGSLALTGIGHGTDRAILLGLTGEKPEELEPEEIEAKLEEIRGTKSLPLLGSHAVGFDEARDLLFHSDQILPGHPNGMRFSAFDESGQVLTNEIYYSIGGGFIVKEGEPWPGDVPALPVPHRFGNGAELLD